MRAPTTTLAILLAALFSSTSANPIAIPNANPNPTTLEPTKVTREVATADSILKFESSIGANIDYGSDFGLTSSVAATNTTGGLSKREQVPDQCWGFQYGLGITRAAYIANLEALRQAFLSSGSSSYYFAPLSTVTWWVGSADAKLTIRNQDSCYGHSMLYSTMAYYILQIQDFCYDESGWIHRNGYGDIIFIAEPNGVAPPAYSPRCNYY